ncbi:MAG: hypothetical protein R3B39_02130 [Candidatus Paceibacterota bacterium]
MREVDVDYEHFILNGKNNPKDDESLEAKVLSSMVFVLSEDSNYRETIRSMKIARFFNIKPEISLSFKREEDVVAIIILKTKEAIKRFQKEYLKV